MFLRGVGRSPTSAIEMVGADMVDGVEVAGMGGQQWRHQASLGTEEGWSAKRGGELMLPWEPMVIAVQTQDVEVGSAMLR